MSPIHVADSVRIALGTDSDCQALADALGQTALPTKMCDTVQGLIDFQLEEKESCAGRQSLWNRAILKDDLDEANRIASEMWRRGSRGTDLAFKSKMLGLPFPPLSEQ